MKTQPESKSVQLLITLNVSHTVSLSKTFLNETISLTVFELATLGRSRAPIQFRSRFSYSYQPNNLGALNLGETWQVVRTLPLADKIDFARMYLHEANKAIAEAQTTNEVFKLTRDVIRFAEHSRGALRLKPNLIWDWLSSKPHVLAAFDKKIAAKEARLTKEKAKAKKLEEERLASNKQSNDADAVKRAIDLLHRNGFDVLKHKHLAGGGRTPKTMGLKKRRAGIHSGK